MINIIPNYLQEDQKHHSSEQHLSYCGTCITDNPGTWTALVLYLDSAGTWTALVPHLDSPGTWTALVPYLDSPGTWILDRVFRVIHLTALDFVFLASMPVQSYRVNQIINTQVVDYVINILRSKSCKSKPDQ